MRIAFFGSDAFSVPGLRALEAAGHEVALVVTNPDRPRGRSGKPRPTPVKEEAERIGCALLQPEGKPGAAVAERIEGLGCELSVVVAYGQIIGRRVRRAAGLGYAINLHASLLPRWRGAAPVAAAILAGDAVTGVSVQKLWAKMDAGSVLLAREAPIGPETTRGALRNALSALGAEALPEAVGRIAGGEAEFSPQDEARATYAPLLQKADGRLDLARPAPELDRRVRAFTPWPGAFCALDTGRLGVLRAAPLAGPPREAPGPGTVLAVGADGLDVATGEGALRLVEVKPAGKRAMRALDYANGRRLRPGDPLA